MANLLNIITSPVDDLLLGSFSGYEELSRLFSFTLQLTSQQDHNVSPDQLVGKPFAFSVKSDLADAEGDAQQEERFFHGYVNRFVVHGSQGGLCRYEIDVVPRMWFLTRTSDCRIFSKKKLLDVVESILQEHEIDFESSNLNKGSYPDREYCVQYRETDFNFISRLLEQEGIYYYFKHSEDGHKLILCDAPSHYRADDNCQEVPYDDSFPFTQASVTQWVRQYQFVSGGYAQTDYNYEENPARGDTSPAELLKSQANIAGPAANLSDVQKYEVFDYPGEYADKSAGDHYTGRRMEEEAAAYDVANGSSLLSHFSAGVKMKLVFPAGPPAHPQKESQDGEYAIRSVQHSGSSSADGTGSGADYSNAFTAIPADMKFRTPRITPKPLISGVQTAVVVGPPGSEIHTDELGRVQLQFFWDRYGTRSQEGDEQEPIWVRVGQISAGKKWGAMFIPRVGQEVIVTFLEGDPDRPLVTGGVYNSDQEPAYNPKENKTRSGIKTCSSPGADGFNELRFEDKKGKEQIYIHAEKDMDVRVKNDSKLRVYGNRHQIVGTEDGGSLYERVYEDKHVDVKQHLVQHIEGNSQLTVGNGDASDGGHLEVVIEKKETRKIGPDGLHLTIEGDCSETIGGGLSQDVGGDQQTKIGANLGIEAGQDIHIKGGMNVVIEAGMQLSLKVGGNFISIGPAGIAIQGTTVLINSGGAAGSGKGAKPKKPKKAKDAKPKEPKVAAEKNKHKAGQISTPF